MILYTKSIGRLGKSDHEIIEVGLNLNDNSSQSERVYYDWKNADRVSMNNYLQNIHWNTELDKLSTEEAWNSIKSSLLHVQDIFVPQHKCKNRNNQTDWLDRDTLKLIRKKRRLWKKYKETRTPDDLSNYKETETEVKKEIRKAKRRYEVKLSQKSNKSNVQFRN